MSKQGIQGRYWYIVSSNERKVNDALEKISFETKEACDSAIRILGKEFHAEQGYSIAKRLGVKLEANDFDFELELRDWLCSRGKFIEDMEANDLAEAVFDFSTSIYTKYSKAAIDFISSMENRRKEHEQG